jgi:hypothetical protein
MVRCSQTILLTVLTQPEILFLILFHRPRGVNSTACEGRGAAYEERSRNGRIKRTVIPDSFIVIVVRRPALRRGQFGHPPYLCTGAKCIMID